MDINPNPVNHDDLMTAVAAWASPHAWVEAFPCAASDEGDVGGDIQAGEGWGRRFVWWASEHNTWVVLNDYYYLCREFREDGAPEDRTWIQNQREFIMCPDFRDPGGTELWADYTYEDLHCSGCPCGQAEPTTEHAREVCSWQDASDYDPPQPAWWPNTHDEKMTAPDWRE